MPSGDRTGPNGMGPATGRQMGYCSGYPQPGYMTGSGGPWARGFGRHSGRNSGRGFGRRGRGFWSTPGFPPPIYPGPAQPSREERIRELQQEAEMLRREQDLIQTELANLEQPDEKSAT